MQVDEAEDEEAQVDEAENEDASPLKRNHSDSDLSIISADVEAQGNADNDRVPEEVHIEMHFCLKSSGLALSRLCEQPWSFVTMTR